MEAVASSIGASMISALLGPLVEKAATEVVAQSDFMFNINREISNLRSTLNLINGIIEEAEEKQSENKHIQNWLSELVDISYEARDVLDEFISISASIRAKNASRPLAFGSSPSCFFLPCSTTCGSSSAAPVVLPFRHQFRLANEIRRIRKKLDNMMKLKDILELKSVGGKSSESVRPEIGPFVNRQRDLFVGRDDEKNEIMQKVLNHNDGLVHVVPIWGMGGVGKTTLARSVYNDGRVTEEHYPSTNRRWLCVGEKDFNAKEIISKIIDESDLKDVEAYQKKLVKKLKGNRFLIVLDDVWEVDSNQWKLLWDPLTNVGKGGIIVMTTRKHDVVSTTNTLLLNHLEPLSYEDCLQIFESHAFIDGNSDNRLDLKGIGQRIVKELNGLPLAAEVVGRSLLNEQEARIWEKFLENREWKLRNSKDDVIPALKWSYNRLPPYLKQCFVYCSFFPKDHVFDENTLIEMWMAHDFIGGGDERRLEETGALYFKELVSASLFQCVDDKYIMHDMIHDLATSVSNGEFARSYGPVSTDQMENIRHMSIHLKSDRLESLNECKSKKLLTLQYIHEPEPMTYENATFPCNFKKFKSIRVLIISSPAITNIPDSLKELIHLRYLDVFETFIESVPDSLCELHNLQILAAPFDAILPKNIVKMINLRHIRANVSTCQGISGLTNLQGVSCITACKDGHIRELGRMQQLRGCLRLKGLENISDCRHAGEAMLHAKKYIDQLTLEFGEGLTETATATKLLDALRCPPNLTCLQITRYNGLVPPSWMADGKHIANLQSLTLYDCHQLESLPPLGELNCLKHLDLSSMHGLKRLGGEFYGKVITGNSGKVYFPSLKTLMLNSMNKLRGWNETATKDHSSVVLFPCLRELSILFCPELVLAVPPAANVMRHLSSLKVSNCEKLVLLNLDNLVSLKCLDIDDCSELIRIASVATTIESLSVKGCEKLEVMDFQSLPSLKKLVVSHCYKLISIPRLSAIKLLHFKSCKMLKSLRIDLQGLNSLEEVSITKCPALDLVYEEASSSSSSSSSTSLSLPSSRLWRLRTNNILVFTKLNKWDKLTSLKELYIDGFADSEVVKNNWHKLTLLELLYINNCENLKLLPPDFQKLSTLKTFHLSLCPQLEALPAGGLPLSLEILDISSCPLLYERCKEESGLDWHKINHIPERYIYS